MRRMYTEDEVKKLIQEYAPEVSPADIQAMFDDGDVSLAGKYVRIMAAPESTTLTDEQIEQISEGCFIEGEFLGYKNPIFLPNAKVSSQTNSGAIIGTKNNSVVEIKRYQINTSKEISVGTEGIWYSNNLLFFVCQHELGFDTKYMSLKINGVQKGVPFWPSNTGTFTLKMVNGELAWVAEV